MKVIAKTDLGKAREINQDFYFIPSSSEELSLFIVADGMGGYNGGEIASRLAVDNAKEYIETHFHKTAKDKINSLLEQAMLHAHRVICEKASQNEELADMGTTLDICLIVDDKLYIGHIGDSRVYKIRNGIITQITSDHSYVESLVKDGTITKEEAYHHPKKNMLIKALGGNIPAEPDVLVKEWKQDDIIIMCTDGLTNMLKENEICDIVMENIEKAHEKLIQKANEHGGYDNITVVIIQNNET